MFLFVAGILIGIGLNCVLLMVYNVFRKRPQEQEVGQVAGSGPYQSQRGPDEVTLTYKPEWAKTDCTIGVDGYNFTQSFDDSEVAMLGKDWMPEETIRRMDNYQKQLRKMGHAKHNNIGSALQGSTHFNGADPRALSRPV